MSDTAELRNPFTPVVGKVPLHFAGRTDILEGIDDVLEGEGNSPETISLYVGARGTGKTALLNYYAEKAAGKGWIPSQVSCAEGMLDEILLRATRAASHLVDLDSPRRVKSASVANIGSVTWEESEKRPQNWRASMDTLLEALQETETGLLITVDEADPKLPEMETLVTCFQHFLAEGRKVALAMAGLPYNVTALLSGKSTSFLRRAARYDLGTISNRDIRESFILMLQDGGKDIETAALAKAVEAIGGFPYMLQLVGYRAWRISGDRKKMTLSDVDEAVDMARNEVEERIYDATWYDLSAADRRFLYAMLEDEKITQQSALAVRLNRNSAHVSKYKKRLLYQGVIQEKAKGRLEICLPGFRDYLEERRNEEE